jgi:molecular chaperone GrpE
MRALADAENARKRAERDRREAEQYGGSRLARDLLPVYDNLNRALDAAREQRAAAAGPDRGGRTDPARADQRADQARRDADHPANGRPFDPQLHQAMFEAPLPGTKAGDIIQVMTEGFLLHDRLRPAQVRPGAQGRSVIS